MRANRRRILVALAAALASISSAGIFAWENHEQLSELSLQAEDWAGRKVAAEELGSFLESTKAELGPLLKAIEAKAVKDYPRYKPLPAALAFDAGATGQALRDSFVGAIRVNPKVPFALFLQLPVGVAHGDRPTLEAGEVNKGESRVANPPFVALAPGEAVAALAVVETASDEPDYGLDLGLFEDNGTAWGAKYGFGAQPFGNPALSYGSQAPFHMSFSAESFIIHALASFTNESYVGYRVDLYSALARFAFRSGHPYWGWRFAGWALHYVQDLVQPWHSSIMPSKSTFDLLVLNAFGSKADVDAAVVLVSNRHSMLECYQYSLLEGWKGDWSASPVFSALRGSGARAKTAKGFLPGGKNWALAVVAPRAKSRGKALDRALAATFDPKYISDPAFDFGAWQSSTNYAYDPLAELLSTSPAKAAAFDAVLAASMADLGEASRGFMRSFAPTE